MMKIITIFLGLFFAHMLLASALSDKIQEVEAYIKHKYVSSSYAFKNEMQSMGVIIGNNKLTDDEKIAKLNEMLPKEGILFMPECIWSAKNFRLDYKERNSEVKTIRLTHERGSGSGSSRTTTEGFSEDDTSKTTENSSVGIEGGFEGRTSASAGFQLPKFSVSGNIYIGAKGNFSETNVNGKSSVKSRNDVLKSSNTKEEKDTNIETILKSSEIGDLSFYFDMEIENRTDDILTFEIGRVPVNFNINVLIAEPEIEIDRKGSILPKAKRILQFKIPLLKVGDRATVKKFLENNFRNGEIPIVELQNSSATIKNDRGKNLISEITQKRANAVNISLRFDGSEASCEFNVARGKRSIKLQECFEAWNNKGEEKYFSFKDNKIYLNKIGTEYDKDCKFLILAEINGSGIDNEELNCSFELRRKDSLVINIVGRVDTDVKSCSNKLNSIEKYAQKGNIIAQTLFGKCYANGYGVEKDFKEAVKWYRKAAEQGNAAAQYNLGGCYANGYGVEKDFKEAVKWYRKAAEQGDADAQNCLGLCYYNGEGVEKNLTEAVKWFRKSVEQGDAAAQNYLGLCYAKGEGVEKNLTEAVKWFRKSAEQGNASAQYNLSVCYDKGEGVEKDLTEAVKWYRKAAEQGNGLAQNNLGVCYDKGEGVEKDLTEVVKWYRKAAEHGNASAQYNLSVCYDKGEGVEKNLTEAVKWFRKAAEQGDAAAQNNLGDCYYYGVGVEKNLTEAVKWYRKSAEQGDAVAQVYLALCYHAGKGLEKNLTEAVKWFRKAAEQGDDDAQYELGKCYLKGEGVEKNLTEAAKWFGKAAEQGHEGAMNALEIMK